jgi:hypothetical protein
VTSLREAVRRRLRSGTGVPSVDPRVSYRLYWTGQARTWSPARRAALLESIGALVQEPDFESNLYRRIYRVDGLDSAGHAGASLVALCEVLMALDEFEPQGPVTGLTPEKDGDTDEREHSD